MKTVYIVPALTDIDGQCNIVLNLRCEVSLKASN